MLINFPDRGIKSLILILIFIFSVVHISYAQIGGTRTYGFLDLPSSARVAALGAYQNSVIENDITLVNYNPAVLDKEMHNHFSISYVPYFADIHFGYLAYAREFKDGNIYYAGMQYINYGKFTNTDHMGNILGEFTAGEYALNIGTAREFNGFRFGSSLKLIYSSLESYNSMGIALDFGSHYQIEEAGWGFGLVMRNLGLQILSYTRENPEPLPLDIQIGISKKLIHTPIRFSMVAHNLQRPDLTYFDPVRHVKRDLETGELVEDSPGLADKIARHLTFGTEILISENFHLRGGYNHQRRKEMTIDQRLAMVGFSYGFGFKVNKFHINYGRAIYHLAGASNHFTVTTNFSDFIKVGK